MPTTSGCEPEDRCVLSLLEAEGVLLRSRDGAPVRTTERWRSAMTRAFRASGHRVADLRIPVLIALVDLCGASLPRGEIARLAELMTSIERLLPDIPRVFASRTGTIALAVA